MKDEPAPMKSSTQKVNDPKAVEEEYNPVPMKTSTPKVRDPTGKKEMVDNLLPVKTTAAKKSKDGS